MTTIDELEARLAELEGRLGPAPMAVAPITIGELSDVPTPGSPVVSQWTQEVTRRSLHRFASITARDAAYPAAGAGAGAICVTLDTGTVWMVIGSAWVALTGSGLPRFRLTGGGAGQSHPDSTISTASWAGGTSSGTAGLVSAGTFTCPAAYPGRWRFEFEAQWPPNNTGIRNAFIQAATFQWCYGYFSAAATNTGNFHIGGSAEIVCIAGTTAAVNMLHSIGAPIAVNTTATSYFQGQYIGPA